MVRKDVTAESVDFSNTGFNSWNTSAIKEWLNETYANKFSQYIKSMIGSTTFLIQTGKYTDSIFSLSLLEVNISGGNLPVSGEILPIYSILLTGVSNSYWLRDRVPNLTSHSYIITQNGTQEEIQINYSEHTRPCFTLPSDTVIDMELNVVEG